MGLFKTAFNARRESNRLAWLQLQLQRCYRVRVAVTGDGEGQTLGTTGPCCWDFSAAAMCNAFFVLHVPN